jgi:hypothetical protein
MFDECRLTRIIQRGNDPAGQAKLLIKLPDRQQTAIACQWILPGFDNDGSIAQKTKWRHGSHHHLTPILRNWTIALARVAASRNVLQPLGLPWMEHARLVRRTKLRRTTTMDEKKAVRPVPGTATNDVGIARSSWRSGAMVRGAPAISG